MKEETKPKFRK